MLYTSKQSRSSSPAEESVFRWVLIVALLMFVLIYSLLVAVSAGSSSRQQQNSRNGQRTKRIGDCGPFTVKEAKVRLLDEKFEDMTRDPSANKIDPHEFARLSCMYLSNKHNKFINKYRNDIDCTYCIILFRLFT